MTASFRITHHTGGKKPIAERRIWSCDDENEAVFFAMRSTIWSHTTGRPRKLPRYVAWSVESRDDTEWILVEEGTLQDAKARLPFEDTSAPEVGAVWRELIARSKGGQPSRARANTRQRRGPSRLSQLVERVLAQQ